MSERARNRQAVPSRTGATRTKGRSSTHPTARAAQLQRHAGNQAVGTLVHGGGPVALQRLMDAGAFRTSTATRGHRRGQAIRHIDKMLAAYHKRFPTRPTSEADIAVAEQMLLQMQYAAAGWQADHTVDVADDVAGHSSVATGKVEDPKRKRRMAGVKAFQAGAGSVAEELTALKKARQDLADTRLTQATAASAPKVARPRSTGAPPPVPPRPLGAVANSVAAAALSEETKKNKQFRRIQQKYEGGPKSLLEKLGPIIDLAAPNSGDGLEMEIDCRFPLDPSGIAFLGARWKLQVERDSMQGALSGTQGDEQLTARTELVLTAGAQIVDVMRAQLELGGFLEASAPNGKAVMALVSYGLYRRWRESAALPAGAADYLWGGRSSAFGRMKAEAWSRSMEKRLFGGADNENYVASGGLIGAKAKAGLKGASGVGAELGGALTYSRGTRYDKKSIEAAKGQLGAQNTRKQGATTDRQAGLGRAINRFSAEFSWETGPLSGGAALHVAWAEAMKGTAVGKEVEAVELGGSIKGSLPAGAGAGASQVQYWGPAIAALVRGIRRIVGQMKTKKKAGTKDTAQGARAVGTAADLATDGLQTVAGVAGPFADTAASAWDAISPATLAEGVSETATTLGSTAGRAAAGKVLEKASTVGVSLAIGFDFIEKTGSIQLSMDKDIALEIPGFMNASVSRSSRLIKLNFGVGGLEVE